MFKKGLIYPTFVDFDGHINIFKDCVVGLLKCKFCNSNVNIKLKGDTSKFSDDYIKNKVLRTAQFKHNCPAKEYLWSDKDVLKKNFSDYLEGYEKLKERDDKKNASGK